MKKETNKSFGHKFIESQDRFFKSKVAPISFVLAVLFFAILQVVLFSTGLLKVQGTTDINSSRAWIYMVISPIGAILSLVGYVYTVRVDQKFFYYTFFGQIITLVSSFISGMTYTGFVMIVMISSGAWRMYLIRKHGQNYEINKKTFYIIGGIIVAALTIGMTIAAIYIPESSWFWNNKSLAFRELDVYSCLVAFIGTLFLVTKNKYAFYMFLLCNIMFGILFIASGAWMNAIQLLIYMVCNTCAAAAWTYRSKHPKEFS